MFPSLFEVLSKQCEKELQRLNETTIFKDNQSKKNTATLQKWSK